MPWSLLATILKVRAGSGGKGGSRDCTFVVKGRRKLSGWKDVQAGGDLTTRMQQTA